MTWYSYILECQDKARYYGHTEDLGQRLQAHQRGQVAATRHRRPVRLVYYETHASRADAFRREQQWKSGRTRKTTIERLIRTFDWENVKGSIRTDELRRSASSVTRVLIEGGIAHG